MQKNKSIAEKEAKRKASEEQKALKVKNKMAGKVDDEYEETEESDIDDEDESIGEGEAKVEAPQDSRATSSGAGAIRSQEEIEEEDALAAVEATLKELSQSEHDNAKVRRSVLFIINIRSIVLHNLYHFTQRSINTYCL